jgi:hypothetical protein
MRCTELEYLTEIDQNAKRRSCSGLNRRLVSALDSERPSPGSSIAGKRDKRRKLNHHASRNEVEVSGVRRDV